MKYLISIFLLVSLSSCVRDGSIIRLIDGNGILPPSQSNPSVQAPSDLTFENGTSSNLGSGLNSSMNSGSLIDCTLPISKLLPFKSSWKVAFGVAAPQSGPSCGLCVINNFACNPGDTVTIEVSASNLGLTPGAIDADPSLIISFDDSRICPTSGIIEPNLTWPNGNVPEYNFNYRVSISSPLFQDTEYLKCY